MRAVLSLGANLGDRLSTLRLGLDAIGGQTTVLAVSPVYETEPVGVVEQGDFFNVVAVVETDLSPRELVLLGQAIENAAGRIRVERWGPRALDIDLIAYEGVVSDDPFATVPHPRAHERAFVLRPWLDVEPDAELPGHGPVTALAATATGRVRQTGYVLRLAP